MSKLTVYNYISIPPDGGSEVGVEGHIQSKVVGGFLKTKRCKVTCKLRVRKEQLD